jgi:N6-adenosine-specific RNA methylase IME4
MKGIAEHAKFTAKLDVKEGRFALIYADPPWSFETYSEKGKDMTSPDNHYPTMSDELIANIEVEGYRVPEITADNSVLLLWCTCANLKRALAVMEAWGFEYKTAFTSDKERTGTGYIALNQTEHLLYGTRGEPPLPMKIFSTLIRSPREKRSEKPGVVRQMIEQMFPHFDEHSRLQPGYEG